MQTLRDTGVYPIGDSPCLVPSGEAYRQASEERALLTVRIESGALELAVVQKDLVKARASQMAEAYVNALPT